MKTLRVAFLSSAVLEFFASVAIAVIAIYIGFGLLGYITYGPAPELTLFSGLLILLLAPEFFQPLRTLSQHYHDRAAALGAGGEILARLSALPRSSALPAPTPAAPPGAPKRIRSSIGGGYLIQLTIPREKPLWSSFDCACDIVSSATKLEFQ